MQVSKQHVFLTILQSQIMGDTSQMDDPERDHVQKVRYIQNI